MHDVRVTLDDQPLGDFDRAGRGDPPDVVAAEVHQHDVLGDLLRVVQKLLFEPEIIPLHGAARTRTGDRTHGDFAAFDAHHHLRRGTRQREFAELQEEQIGRGVDRAKAPIDVEWRGAERAFEALRENHLDDVTRVHVLLRAPHHCLVVSLAEVRA